MTACSAPNVVLGCVFFAAASCRSGAAPEWCNADSRKPSTLPITHAERGYDSIVIAIEAPSVACIGTPVPVRVVLRNVAGRELVLTHTAGDFAGAIEIRSDPSNLPQSFWHSNAVPHTPGTALLRKGDSLELVRRWPRGSWSEDMRPGRYRAIGRVALEMGPWRPWPETPFVEFILRPNAALSKAMRLGPCSIARATTADSTIGAHQYYDSLAISIEIPTANCVGSPVPMTLIVRGVGAGEFDLFPTTFESDSVPKSHPFIAYFDVQDEQRRPLWRGESVIYVAAGTSLTAKDSLVFRVSWPLSSSESRTVGKGRYFVIGHVSLRGGFQAATPPLGFSLIGNR